MTPHPLSQSRQLKAAMEIIAQRKQQIGPVAVTFTIGRIQSRSPLLAAGAGDPANLPAVLRDGGPLFEGNDDVE